MKKYAKNIDDRKVMVSRLSELTGLDARYTRVPRCAYEVGAFIVEKDGSLTVEDGADESILQTLISENMIGACIEEIHPVSPDQTETETMQIIQPDLGTEEWGEDDWQEAEEPSQPQEEQEVWQPETDFFAERTEQTENTDIVETETTDADTIPDAEYEQEAEEESAASLGIRDVEEPMGFPMDARISFPLSKHTVASLINLICMIHTRGPLLSKATGGVFHADKDLVDDILDRHTFFRIEELIAFVQEWDGSENALQGISFDEEKVTFDGFRDVRDADHLQAFTKLAAAMNKTAQTQKRVQAKETDDSNEKYSLRVWLVRMGMNGSEYKAERKILMKNLTGHSAFRTPADEEKWKAKQQVKRDALRAAKAAKNERDTV
jgi:hypothetical protein